MIITSKDNKLIKEIKKLKEKKYRTNKFIIEGEKMLEEAIKENAEIETIVVSENFSFRNNDELNRLVQKVKNASKIEFENNDKGELKKPITDKKIIVVSSNVFKELSDVKTPQGVLAVVAKKENSNKIDFNENYILALDGVQDPGNMGTIIRTLDAANVHQLIVSKETVDSYSPKVIRSTMGSIFRVNVIEVENLKETLEKAQGEGFKVISTALDAKESIYEVNYNKKIVVIGNEANGVSKDIQDISDIKVKIPMPGKAESLNASVAAGLMIYEYVRESHNK